MIDQFKDEYFFLSNFYPSEIIIDNITFPTVEHYFQAMKTVNQSEIIKIADALTPGEAKRLGRRVHLRADWESIKDEVMLNGLRKKFSIPELKDKLLATKEEYLVEGNTWGDKYWGICDGEGENHLGILLMKVRKEIQND